MSYRMDGKSVIVTGAAHGIGLAIAQRFVRAGACVTMVDRDEDRLEREVEALAGEGHDGRAQAFAGDIAQKLTATNLMAATLDAFEAIDVLVNAARLVSHSDPLGGEGDRFEEVIAQNVTATYRLCQVAARRMLAESDEPLDASIINLSSIYARRAPTDLLAYAVSCAAIEHLTRLFAAALAPKGIRVNALSVGGVPSRSLADGFGGLDDLSERVSEAVPLGRAGAPADIAEAALFLASPGAAFVTGSVLTVDGGRLLVDPLRTEQET
ncbi:SDR family oxidoreductase [soil metagenome]